MKIHHDAKADHLTLTFRETNRFGHDVIVEGGKVCLTFEPDGALTEIEVGEASKNGEPILSYCNLSIAPEIEQVAA